MAQKVLVLGQGYVGLPLAVTAVEAGFDVVGFDIDADKVSRIGGGQSTTEDVPDPRLADALATGRYEVTADTAELDSFDVAVISVPTPLRDGAPDLSFIESAAQTLAGRLRPGCLVILESTTYPGTTEELVQPLLEAGSGLAAGRDFHLGYSPERIDPGNLTWRFENTPKVVAGLTPACLEAVSAFYGQLVETVIPVASLRTAELCKLLENTFRHVNIALVNELAMFAHALDINIWDAIDAAATKPFGFMRFTPGPGVGGHCLPIDPSYLSWRVKRTLGHTFRFVELANDINDHMPDYVVHRLLEAFNARGRVLRGARVLLLGVAYKRNTGDAREAPSRAVAHRLQTLGAHVVAADPHVTEMDLPPGVELVEATEDEARGADAVVILVDHDAFDVKRLTGAARYVLDTRRVVDGDNVEHL